jgi:hypothetical protein
VVYLFDSLRGLAISSFGLLPLGAALAGPVTVEYELASLGTPGRYEYRYTVTNVALASPVSWFSVDFDPALYDESSLLITSTGLGDWSEQILGSIPILDVPAQYDAYKTTGTPLDIGDSEAGFTVQFTWLGTGTPGAQAFTVYDPGNLDVLYVGLTSAAAAPPPGMPEPATPALVLLALAGANAARRRMIHMASTQDRPVTAA